MRPDGISGYEEHATSIALFKEGDLVFVQLHPTQPRRSGKVKWRRWECGNQCWGYAVNLDELPGDKGTMAIEDWISPR